MLRPRPGSFHWLLANDLRLSRRRFADVFRKMSPISRILVIGAGVLVLHGLAYPVASWLTGIQSKPEQIGMFRAVMAAGILFILPWLIAQSLTGATRILFARGDLDLLLASPISSRAVLTSRAVALAIETMGSVAILLTPLANMCAVLGGLSWLGIYPVLIVSSLLAAGIGLSLAMALLRLVGPRRARLVSQIVATIIGASFVLSMQGIAILSETSRIALIDALAKVPEGSLLHHTSSIWLPVRAALGEPEALMLWAMLGAGIFALAIAGLAGTFANAILTTAGSPQAQTRRRASLRMRFDASLGASLRRKEWRLLSRDPFLGSQLFLQIIYTLPMSIVLWRSQGAAPSLGLAIAPSLVVIAAQMSASLSWLAISGEDAPEFLQASPVPRGARDRQKLIAIAGPVAALMAVPVLGLMIIDLSAGLLSVVYCTLAGVSTALINLWHPIPGNRRNMINRHQQSKLVGLMEHAMSLLWAMAVVMTLFKSNWFFVPMLIALATLLQVRRWHGVGRSDGTGGAKRTPTAPPLTEASATS